MDTFDLFELSSWAVMVAGFLAVAVPAYWLVSGWRQDRGRTDTLSDPVENDTPSFVRIRTAGEALPRTSSAAYEAGAETRR